MKSRNSGANQRVPIADMAIGLVIAGSLLIVGCGDGNNAATAAAPLGPLLGNLSPCSEDVVDRWEFDVRGGQTVVVRADTVDASTASDLRFYGSCDGGDYFDSNDEFACAFPPTISIAPALACPQATFTASVSEHCTVTVGAFGGPSDTPCSDPRSSGYVLRITGDGADLGLSLSEDNVANNSGTNRLVVSPVMEDLTPCFDEFFDTYALDVRAGQKVFIYLDTVDAATSADLFVDVYCNIAGLRLYMEDEVDCTFPPPPHPTKGQGRCPRGVFTPTVTETCELVVGSDQFPPDPFGCAQRGKAGYRLKVTRNGFNTALTLVADDEWAP